MTTGDREEIREVGNRELQRFMQGYSPLRVRSPSSPRVMNVPVFSVRGESCGIKAENTGNIPREGDLRITSRRLI